MKQFSASHAAVVLLLLSGCGQANRTEPSVKPKNPIPPPARFRLTGTKEPIQVLNGTQTTLDVDLSWTGGPPEDVRLAAGVTPADRGVTVKVEPGRVKPGDSEKLRVIVTVGEAALPGDYQVKVTAQVDQSAAASHTFTVRVPEKE